MYENVTGLTVHCILQPNSEPIKITTKYKITMLPHITMLHKIENAYSIISGLPLDVRVNSPKMAGHDYYINENRLAFIHF